MEPSKTSKTRLGWYHKTFTASYTFYATLPTMPCVLIGYIGGCTCGRQWSGYVVHVDVHAEVISGCNLIATGHGRHCLVQKVPWPCVVLPL